MEGRYADAIVFCDDEVPSREIGGVGNPGRFPLDGSKIIVCEAKSELTPELIGQALVYARFATRAGAQVKDTIVFAERGSKSMQQVAVELRLSVVIRALEG
jgi:hypothetical protein